MERMCLPNVEAMSSLTLLHADNMPETCMLPRMTICRNGKNTVKCPQIGERRHEVRDIRLPEGDIA